ncbi:MAG TPA: ATP-binding protein [Lachnospiraceae bacterium]|nr:ATP-binding protein [Lachnospiraceae bacterium]
MIEIIYNIPISIFEIYMFYDFFQGGFRYRNEKKKIHLFVLIGLFFAITFVNAFQNSVINILLLPFLYFFASILLFREPVKKLLFHNLIFYIIMAGIEVGFEVAFSIVSGDILISVYQEPVSRMMIVLFEKLISFLVLKAVKNSRRPRSFPMEKSLYRLVYLLPFVSFLIYGGITYSEINLGVFSIQKGVLVLGCFLLVPINIVVFYLLERLSDTMEKTKNLELAALKQELEEVHYERVDEINEEHKKYLHDMQHYFKMIGDLAQLGEDGEIIKIIKDMDIEIEKIRRKRFCRHPIVNAMLCETEEKARRNEISYHVKMDPITDFSLIDDFSLICMTGNLLQNAFEAAVRSEQNRFIHIEAHLASNKKFIVFCIKNGFDDAPVLENGEYLTSKQDKAKHGIGIRNVRERAESYGGFLITESEDHVFSATLELAAETSK